MNLLKGYYRYIKDPQNALQTFLQERSFKQALCGYFFAALSWVLFFNIGSGLSVPVLLFKLAVLWAAELTLGYFLASLCGLFLDFGRIKTSPAELFILVGSAGFIKGLLVAFALVSAAFAQARLVYLAPIWVLGVFGLQLGYLTRGLMRSYHIPAAKALGAWLFTGVPVAVALLLLAVFAGWGIVLLF